MKERKQSNSQSVKKTSSPATNFFLNVIIILLGGSIVFLSYSLFTKISALTSDTDQTGEIKNTRIIQLEVLNGCGVTGVAEKFTNYLRQNDFDVVQVGNYMSYDINNTLVVDRIGNKNNALRVAKSLGIDAKNVIQQINNDYFLDVSLIIGKDFNLLEPFK